MTKITRKDQQIFASTAGDESVAKFGSLAAGSPGYSTDPDEIQTDEYKGGWESAVIGQASPTMEDRNSLDYLFSRQLAYLYQTGIPAYSSTDTYYKGSIVSFYNTEDDALKLYYSIIDDNTGNSLEDDTKWVEWKSGGGGANLPLLTFQFTDHELNDMSWLKANFSWNSADVYIAASRHLQNDLGFRYESSTLSCTHSDFDNGTYVRISDLDQTIDTTTYYAYGISGTTDPTKCVYTLTTTLANGVKLFYYKNSAMLFLTSSIVTPLTETIKGTTVTYYRAADGHKIVKEDQVDNITAIYNATGVAWYFVYDATNSRFKLPRTNWNLKGANCNPGDFVDESLPNIKGEFALGGSTGFPSTALASGAFSVGTTSYANAANATVATAASRAFDASNSSPVYQNNAHVQEKATTAFLYFYVGVFDQAGIEQSAGINVENFQNKADTDLGNVNHDGTTLIAHNAMPSTSYEDLTLGASGDTYTAPADGYYYFSKKGTNGQYMRMAVGKDGVWLYGNLIQVAQSSGEIEQTIPIAKGFILDLRYNLSGATNFFRFIYANGSKPQV